MRAMPSLRTRSGQSGTEKVGRTWILRVSSGLGSILTRSVFQVFQFFSGISFFFPGELLEKQRNFTLSLKNDVFKVFWMFQEIKVQGCR